MSAPKRARTTRRVGIVGYGQLGQYLANAVKEAANLELSFVWNRSVERLRGEVAEELILEDLDDFVARRSDLIVEVSHPSITKSHGVRFLQHCDYLLGSPTAFADVEVEQAMRAQAAKGEFGVYVPAGAMWGAGDIKKMADRGSLSALTVTMTKTPGSLKLVGDNDVVKMQKKAEGVQGETVLYDGCVRDLCPIAPNNVNTMAAAAIAAHNLGFGKVRARLVADPRLTAHIVDVEVTGSPGPPAFTVTTRRFNPASKNAVTGSATYASFHSSLLQAQGLGPGVHLC